MEELYIYAPTDKLPLSISVFVPAKPKAIIQLVHGMCEHKERYYDFIDHLVNHNFVVIIHDNRGHGKSIKSEADLGYFYQNGSYALIEDVHAVNKYIKSRYPDLPLFLMGHSMGSLIVRCYLDKYEETIDGLVICGSPSYNHLSGLAKGLCRLLAMVKNMHYRSSLMSKLVNGTFNRGNQCQNGWICSDQLVVDKYNNDPYCNFNFTLNGYYNLFALMIKTYKKRIDARNKELPVLFVSGRNDPCLINLRAFFKAVDQFKHRGYQNVISLLFDDMSHEILNETNKEEVYTILTNYFNKWTLEIKDVK